MTSDLAQASAVATSSAQGAQSFRDTLSSQKASESGVSLDDQTIQLMGYQRAYQASANYIQTIQQLLQTLLQISRLCDHELHPRHRHRPDQRPVRLSAVDRASSTPI